MLDSTTLSIIIGAVVMGGLALAWMAAQNWGERKSLDKRLGRLTGQATPTLESAGILMPEEKGKGFIEQLLPNLPNLETYFAQANFKMPPSKFWVLSIGLGIMGLGVPLVAGMPIIGLVLGPVLGFAPWFYVSYLRRRRLDKFGGQLGEALELVARALRAGHSLAAAMHTVAEEMPDPISTEFGRVYEEQNLGISLEQAMKHLADRVPNLDLKFFVTAVIIQRQTGGDLAEILDKIGYLIRERFKIIGMVKALTGEGRISGVVLIGLPFVLLLVMMQISPTYVALLWEHPMGRWMSALGIVSMTVGALVIRKIVNIKI